MKILEDVHRQIDDIIGDYINQVTSSKAEINSVPYDEIGSFLRESRKANNLTQVELADMSGLSVLTIQNIERMKCDFSVKSMRAMTQVLGLKVCIS